MEINIAFGVNQNWLKFTRVTIASILMNANSKDDYNFYILCENVSKKDLEDFEKLSGIRECKIKFIEIEPKMFDGLIHDWLGVSSSYRLALPEVTDLDKVLYLDSDIIVNKDISEIYNIDVSDYYLAAVEDKLSAKMKARVGLTKHETFINGGVQLINLKKFREEYIIAKVFDKLRRSNFYTDQDVINDVCRSKILQLPLKYNCMPSEKTYPKRRDEYEECIKDPFVIHYAEKPWIWFHRRTLLGELWIKYASFVEGL